MRLNLTYKDVDGGHSAAVAVEAHAVALVDWAGAAVAVHVPVPGHVHLQAGTRVVSRL